MISAMRVPLCQPIWCPTFGFVWICSPEGRGHVIIVSSTDVYLQVQTKLPVPTLQSVSLSVCQHITAQPSGKCCLHLHEVTRF